MGTINSNGLPGNMPWILSVGIRIVFSFSKDEFYLSRIDEHLSDISLICQGFATLSCGLLFSLGHCSNVGHNFMRLKALISTFALGGFLFFTHHAVAQEQSVTNTENQDQDSARNANERQAEQVEQDAESMKDLKQERAQTRTKAKEARRLERDANDAAVESRNAYRTEKKAQRTRKSADAQAKKARKARDKSDEN